MLFSCLSLETLGRSARGFLFNRNGNGKSYPAAEVWGRSLVIGLSSRL